MPRIIRQSDVACPRCGFVKREKMPTNACQVSYACGKCGATLRPKAGDCCVYCSYGSVPCPPVQAARARRAAQP
jgi:DNA-directed RNA polymerase subunit RPC12/RpoP